MYQIRIEFTFDSGHRLLDYNGKCAYPHGHTCRAEVYLESQSLKEPGLVYDFTDLKDRIKTWVNDNWEHAFLVNSRDSEVSSGLAGAELVWFFKFQDENSSYEGMSRALYEKTSEFCDIAPAKVRLWESVNQYAEYFGAPSIGKA
ncbi:MAG: 6-carboxytetrahydropterin synthase [Dehalococcoidia bacterium]|nr:6-carboxytetrahydropterin synthase [Dehalococcoidia bacterium]